MPTPRTKIHHVHYIPIGRAKSVNSRSDVLAVSTEDGRILFYSSTASKVPETDEPQSNQTDYLCHPICQLGGKQSGLTGRIKDFEVLEVPKTYSTTLCFLVITAGSDGIIRIWNLTEKELNMDIDPVISKSLSNIGSNGKTDVGTSNTEGKLESQSCQVGDLLGSYETGRRITCLKAFVMPDILEVVRAPDGAISDEFSEIERITNDSGSGNNNIQRVIPP